MGFCAIAERACGQACNLNVPNCQGPSICIGCVKMAADCRVFVRQVYQAIVYLSHCLLTKLHALALHDHDVEMNVFDGGLMMHNPV